MVFFLKPGVFPTLAEGRQDQGQPVQPARLHCPHLHGEIRREARQPGGGAASARAVRRGEVHQHRLRGADGRGVLEFVAIEGTGSSGPQVSRMSRTQVFHAPSHPTRLPLYSL
jgi:hypothetical protein